MFLGYNSLLKYGIIQGGDLSITPSEYTGIEFFGEIEIDNVHIVNYTMTDAEIGQLNPMITPTWIVGKTIFLATFDSETLSAGNVGDLTDTITGLRVLRKTTSDTKYDVIFETDSPALTQYDDYTAYSRETFEYALVPVTASVLGTSLPSNLITTAFDSWYLLSNDGSVYYRLCNEVKVASFDSNNNIAELQTAGRYNTFNMGNKNFISGVMSVIPSFGYLDSAQLYQPLSEMDKFRNFILDGNTKILKSPKGEIMKVFTSNYASKLINEGEPTQLYKISFSFSQVEDM